MRFSKISHFPKGQSFHGCFNVKSSINVWYIYIYIYQSVHTDTPNSCRPMCCSELRHKCVLYRSWVWNWKQFYHQLSSEHLGDQLMANLNNFVMSISLAFSASGTSADSTNLLHKSHERCLCTSAHRLPLDLTHQQQPVIAATRHDGHCDWPANPSSVPVAWLSLCLDVTLRTIQVLPNRTEALTATRVLGLATAERHWQHRWKPSTHRQLRYSSHQPEDSLPHSSAVQGLSVTGSRLLLQPQNNHAHIHT